MAKSKKYIYHIIITSNGREIKDIYHSAKETSAYNKFNALVKKILKRLFFQFGI